MQGAFHIGANIIVERNGKILLGLRKKYGAGSWGLPGGFVEVGEELENAARRELLEETGIVAVQLELLNVVNQPRRAEPGRHFVQFLFHVRDPEGEPQNLEPDRCEEWRWFDANNLPENLFLPHKKPLELFRRGGSFAEESNIV